MSIALKPDVSTLQKMGNLSCMSVDRSAEQKFVTNCINGLSRKLKVMRQSGSAVKSTFFVSQKHGAKVYIFDTLLRHYF